MGKFLQMGEKPVLAYSGIDIHRSFPKLRNVKDLRNHLRTELLKFDGISDVTFSGRGLRDRKVETNVFVFVEAEDKMDEIKKQIAPFMIKYKLSLMN